MRSLKPVKGWISATPTAIAAIALLLWPVAGMAISTVCTKTAAEICAAAVSTSNVDSDGDGITDYEECNGLTLSLGKKYLGVFDALAGEHLDPTKPDLFYLLYDASAKDLATTSLLYKATNGTLDFYSAGLRVNTHRIMKADIKAGSDRFIMWNTATPTVARLKAAVIIENTTTGVSLGLTKEGAPQGPLSPQVTSTIYTTRIKANVDKNCPTGRLCSIQGTTITNNNGTDNSPIINYFIRQVVSHELAHASYLAVPKPATPCNCPADNSTATTTNYHYADQSLIMAAQTTFGTAQNATTGATEGMYAIGTIYDPILDTYGLTLK